MIYGEFALLTIYAFSFTRYFSIFGLKITKKIGFERTRDKKKKKKKKRLVGENIHNAINFPSALAGMPRSPHSNICLMFRHLNANNIN